MRAPNARMDANAGAKMSHEAAELNELIARYRAGGDRAVLMRDAWDHCRDSEVPDEFVRTLFSPRDELNPSSDTMYSIEVDTGDIEIGDLAFSFMNEPLQSTLFLGDAKGYLLMASNCDGEEIINAKLYLFDRTREHEIRTLPSVDAGRLEFVLTKEFSFMSGTGPGIEVGTQFFDFILDSLGPKDEGATARGYPRAVPVDEGPFIAWSHVHEEDYAAWELFCYNNYSNPRIIALMDRGITNLSDADRKAFSDIIIDRYEAIWAAFEIDDPEEYDECFPEIGERNRERNREEREPHVILRTLVDQRRATTTQQLYFRRVDIPRTSRGDAAAATWIFRGRVAATLRLRRGYSVETSNAAAGTRPFGRDRRAPQVHLPLRDRARADLPRGPRLRVGHCLLGAPRS